MALNIGTLTAYLNVDGKQFSAGMVDASKKVDKFKETTGGLTKAVGEVKKSTGATSNALQSMSFAMGDAAGESNKLLKGVSNLAGALVLGGPLVAGMAALAAGITLVKNAMDEAAEGERAFAEGLNGVATAVENRALKAITEMRDMTSSLSEELKNFGKTAAEIKINSLSEKLEEAKAKATGYDVHASSARGAAGTAAKAAGAAFRTEGFDDAMTAAKDAKQVADNLTHSAKVWADTAKEAQIQFDAGVSSALKLKELQEEAAALAKAKAEYEKRAADEIERQRDILSLAARFGTQGGAAVASGAGGSAGIMAAMMGTPLGQGVDDRTLSSDFAMSAEESIDLIKQKNKALADSIYWEGIAADNAREAAELSSQILDSRTKDAARASGLATALTPDLAGIAGAAVGGAGFAAGGAALGAMGGAAAGTALGGPAGTLVGQAVGGGLGNMVGGLIDALGPLKEAGDMFSGLLNKLAEPIGAIFEPLLVLGHALELVVDQAILPFERKWEHVMGQVLMIAAELIAAFLPLAALILIDLNPGLQLVMLELQLLMPALKIAVDALADFSTWMLRVTNILIDIVNSLGADMKKFEEVGEYAACFVAGTLVRTPSGPRPIETIMIGELVIGRDGVESVVARTMKHAVKKTRLVILERETITTTDEHPFFVDERKDFARADSLNTFDHLLAFDGSTPTVHASVSVPVAHTDTVDVYNLEVAGAHTYYVGETGGGVLVHNKDAQKEQLKAAKEAAEAAAKAAENVEKASESNLNLPEAFKLARARANAIDADGASGDTYGHGRDSAGDLAPTVIVYVNGIAVEQLEQYLDDRGRFQQTVQTGIPLQTPFKRWSTPRRGN